MKIDTKLIRSAEIILKPDGRYLRIGYAKPESSWSSKKAKAKETLRRAWRKPVVKTVIIATAAAVLYNLIATAAGM